MKRKIISVLLCVALLLTFSVNVLADTAISQFSATDVINENGQMAL